MRRPPPNFKVERRTSRRPARSNSLAHDDAIDPSYDDIPTRDVRSDEEELALAHEAERRFYGAPPAASSAQRYREDAERLFAKQPEEPTLPIDSVDIFPPMRQVKAEPVVEAAPEPPKVEAEPVRRILQSVTWVDPVEQRLREEEEKRQARKTRAPREPREVRAKAPRKLVGTRSRSQAAFDFTPPPEPVQQPVVVQQVESLDQFVPARLPALARRARHPEPRILYNAWNYPRYLRDAREMPKDVAAIILKPGEGWKRRLPVAAWK